MKHWKALKMMCVIFIFGLFQGCVASSQNFLVKVDAISSIPKNTEWVSYQILPASNDLQNDSLQYNEYKAFISSTMSYRDYLLLNPVITPKVMVLLDYGIGDPQEHTTSFALPIINQTGVSSATTTGSVISNGNIATITGSTTYTPTYGITGFQSFSRRSVTRLKYIMLEAVDYNKFLETGIIDSMWRVTITENGPIDDLRRVFPVMLAAAIPYIGENTFQRKSINISETDIAVVKIKNFDIVDPVFGEINFSDNAKKQNLLDEK